MKKMISLLLALLLPMAALPAVGEEDECFQLSGVISELTETGFLLEDAQQGTVEVLLGEATELLGDLAEQEEEATLTEGEDIPAELVENAALTLSVGCYVTVTYDGKMTRSLPPQVTAQSVSCYAVSGVVSELGEDSLMLISERLGDVMVHLSEAMPQVWEGGFITVYFDGAMTASLPPQISALYIERPTLVGEMSDATDDDFLLTTDDGDIFQVLLGDTTLLSGTMADGDRVAVLYSGETTQPAEEVPAQLTAYAVMGIAR